ncbi:MAG: M20 family peptidase [Cyclobacteriaceae bacterium]|nr:M20 family peptidase [Cyclobacteriaceae bacterium]
MNAKSMGSIFLFLMASIIGLILYNAVRITSRQLEPQDSNFPELNNDIFKRLSQSINYKTVSNENFSVIDSSEFLAFHQFLIQSFPNVFNKLEVEVYNTFGLLLYWKGSDSKLPPIVITAHMDVVPAEDSKKWAHNPFSGHDDGTFIWGRGSLDDKGSLMAIFETINLLITDNFRPAADIYFAFGHDEEITGKYGASAIANALKKKNIKADFVLDEGMVVTQGLVPFMKNPVALIGTSEKGFMNVRLSVEADGGHASTPANENAVSLLAAAVDKLNRNPLPKRFCKPVEDFIIYLSPELPFFPKLIFANKWLFKPIILSVYEKSASGNALVRTTAAPTLLMAGVKDNVIPDKASVLYNIRLLPGDEPDDIIQHIKKTLNDDRFRIEVDHEHLQHPSPVSEINTPGFIKIHQSIKNVFPDATVCPTLMLGASDSRHYSIISENIYRFAPYIVTDESIDSIHGVNERISRKNYEQMISFYYTLIRQC